jgi:rare lipoprotein A
VIRARSIATAALSALVLTVAGCHKKTQAYRPPPPPTTTTTASNAHSRKSTAPTGNATSSATTPSQPAPSPDLQGKPISIEVGMASWYGPPYAGRKGADGTVYDQNAMTAAHLTLPLGTTVRVTNLTTNQSAVVRITDRGPFVHGRIIDLSLAAAKATGLYRMGVAKVKVEAYAAPVRQNATPGGRWCVQVGAFANEKDAVDLKNRLMRRYATAKVIEFAGPTGHWVRINPQQPDHAHATEVAESIHVRDAEPYIIRTD